MRTLLMALFLGLTTTGTLIGQSAVPINVASFNIRYGSANDGDNHWLLRRPTVVTVMRGFEADFIGVQEALTFQIDYLREALPGYRVIYRTREAGPETGEACPIFYRPNRWRLDTTEQGTFWLSDTPAEPGSTTWGNSLPRIVTWGRFIHTETGQGVYVYNAHFDHRSEPSRIQSAELLGKRIGLRRHSSDPVIVLGDLNADEKSSPLSVLTSQPVNLVDSFRVLHPRAKQVGTFHGFTGSPRTGKIDFVLVTPGVKVREAAILNEQVNGRWPSDHFPVTATLMVE